MVEIKRRTPGQGYIRKPIGVNKVNTESANAYAAEARMFNQIASTGFAVAAGLQKRANIKDEKAGIAFAETAVTIDEQGNASVKPIPDGLGAYGKTAAQEEVVRRYSIASENQLRSAHKLISAQANGDGELYKTLWSQYVADKSDLIVKSDASPYLDDFINIANSYGASGFVDMELERYKQDQEQAQTELRINILDSGADIVRLSAGQKFDAASDVYNQKEAEIKASTLLSPDAKAQSIRFLQKNRVEGFVSGVTAEATSAELLQISNDAADLKWSKETLQRFPELANISKEMNIELWSGVGSNASIAQSKANQLEVAQFKVNQSFQAVSFGTATPEQLDSAMTESGVNPISIFTEPTEQMSNLIQDNGSYSASQKTRFDRVASGRTANVQEILAVEKVFRNENMGGGAIGAISKKLGLNDETFATMLFISNKIQTAGDSPTEVLEAVTQANTVRTDLDFIQHATKLGGSQIEVTAKDTGITIVRKIASTINEDIPASVKERYLPLYSSIIGSSNSISEAEDIIEKFYEDTYASSNYIYNADRSLYAPEKVFGQLNALGIFTETEADTRRSGVRAKPEDSVRGNNAFERFVNSKVINASSLRDKDTYLFGGDGANVKLEVVESLSDGKNATYRLIDERTGSSLTDINGPVMFNTSMMQNLIKLDQMSREEDQQSVEERNRRATEKLLGSSIMFGR
tara:strand:+ start:368 stop:2452 length:2085 start_codon:yes stop_codon:yes gene_type:complete